MQLRSLTVLALAAALALTASADAAWVQKPAPVRTTLTDGGLTVDVVDLSPQFLAFYAAAKGVADPDVRFKLWQTLYGFAAVPPTPQGKVMARRLVDGAWSRWSEAVPAARAGEAGMKPPPLAILHKVAQVLDARGPLHIQLITYIGGFEDNAFSYRGALPVVAIPLESPADKRGRFLAHEGTHAVHMLVDNLSGGWERTVAATMLQEGLAMHVTREVFPGLPITTYVSNDPAWWDASRAKERVILEELREKLGRSDSDTVTSVTVGKAPNSGLVREAYYGGWRVVEQLRRDGMSLAQIARIPEAEMPARVEKALDEMLAGKR